MPDSLPNEPGIASFRVPCISLVIDAEVSMGFEKREELDKAVSGCGILMAEIPKEALFPAGKAFAGFRSTGRYNAW